jgi:hypothetical protein
MLIKKIRGKKSLKKIKKIIRSKNLKKVKTNKKNARKNKRKKTIRRKQVGGVTLEEKRAAFIFLSSSPDGVHLRDNKDVIINRRGEKKFTLESIIQCEFLINIPKSNITEALNSILGKSVEFKDVGVWSKRLKMYVVTGESPEKNEYIEIVKRDDFDGGYDYYAKLTDEGKKKFIDVYKEARLSDIIPSGDGTQKDLLAKRSGEDKQKIEDFEQRNKEQKLIRYDGWSGSEVYDDE